MAAPVLKFATTVEDSASFAAHVTDGQAPSTLTVVDAHAKWCGPAESLNKKLQNVFQDLIECARHAPARLCCTRAAARRARAPGAPSGTGARVRRRARASAHRAARGLRSYDIKLVLAVVDNIAALSEQARRRGPLRRPRPVARVAGPPSRALAGSGTRTRAARRACRAAPRARARARTAAVPPRCAGGQVEAADPVLQGRLGGRPDLGGERVRARAEDRQTRRQEARVMRGRECRAGELQIGAT